MCFCMCKHEYDIKNLHICDSEHENKSRHRGHRRYSKTCQVSLSLSLSHSLSLCLSLFVILSLNERPKGIIFSPSSSLLLLVACLLSSVSPSLRTYVATCPDTYVASLFSLCCLVCDSTCCPYILPCISVLAMRNVTSVFAMRNIFLQGTFSVPSPFSCPLSSLIPRSHTHINPSPMRCPCLDRSLARSLAHFVVRIPIGPGWGPPYRPGPGPWMRTGPPSRPMRRMHPGPWPMPMPGVSGYPAPLWHGPRQMQMSMPVEAYPPLTSRFEKCAKRHDEGSVCVIALSLSLAFALAGARSLALALARSLSLPLSLSLSLALSLYVSLCIFLSLSLSIARSRSLCACVTALAPPVCAHVHRCIVAFAR